nr:MAG TPA: hypothetical protein [Caudoviricetes sp.]
MRSSIISTSCSNWTNWCVPIINDFYHRKGQIEILRD